MLSLSVIQLENNNVTINRHDCYDREVTSRHVIVDLKRKPPIILSRIIAVMV